MIYHVDGKIISQLNLKKSGCTHLYTLDNLEKVKSELEKTATAEIISGGAGANTAHALSALGAQVSLSANIAADDIGRSFKNQLATTGVTAYLNEHHIDGIASTQVLGLITPDGDRTFASYDGVASIYQKQDIPQELLKAGLVYIDGHSVCSEKLSGELPDLCKTVKSHGGKACLNVGDRSYIESKPQIITSILNECDGFICNRAEAGALYGDENDTATLATIMADIFEFGAVTDGANGACVFNQNKIEFIPAQDISHIPQLDSIGAGDHFSAGLLYGLLHGMTLDQSGKLATLCATDCLSHPGGRPTGGHGSLKHLVEQVKS